MLEDDTKKSTKFDPEFSTNNKGNKEISKLFSVAEGTVRKWCLALERNGYEFKRGLKESRVFNSHDIAVLADLKILIDKKMKADQAARIVVAEFKNKGMVTAENKDDLKRIEEKLDSVKEDLKKLIKIINKEK